VVIKAYNKQSLIEATWIDEYRIYSLDKQARINLFATCVAGKTIAG